MDVEDFGPTAATPDRTPLPVRADPPGNAAMTVEQGVVILVAGLVVLAFLVILAALARRQGD